MLTIKIIVIIAFYGVFSLFKNLINMNKIVILPDSVSLFEHYISDENWERTLAFPRGGLTYLISNGTIKFYAYEDYFYRNCLMSMPLPIHITDDYNDIDDDFSDVTEITEVLDRIFPTNDIDYELDNYYTKMEADDLLDEKLDASAYTPVDLSDYVTFEDLDDALEDYYTKEEVEAGLDVKLDASAYTPTDLSDYYTKEETNGLLDGKLDASAYTPTDLSNYYNKQEVDSAVTALNSSLTAHTTNNDIHVTPEEKSLWNGKLDASAYTPTDLSNYYNKQEVDAALSGYATEQWVENQGYLTEHQHLKTLNGESLVGDGNIVISGGGDMSNYYNKTETNNLLDTKLDASAYTPVDLTNYATKQWVESKGYVTSSTTQSLQQQITILQQQINSLSIALDACCSGSPTPTPIYRTVSGTPYCVGYDKVVETTSQVSNDNGSTWSNIPSSTTVTLVEQNSLDCGYVSSSKIIITNETGETRVVACNGQPLVKSETVVGGDSGTTCVGKSAVIGGCVTEIAEDAFSGDRCLTSVTVPSSVTTIGRYAFGSTNSLLSITLPNSVTSIGSAVFQNSGIETISIPTGISAITSTMFYQCYNLSNVVIPSNIRSIGSGAFMNCSGLTSVDIQSQNLTNIVNDAFKNCNHLSSITVRSTTIPTLGSGAFTNTNNCPIYVPANMVNSYKAASGWSDYASRIQAITT